MTGFVRRGVYSLAVLAALALAGCSSTSLNRAPVEDRGSVQSKPQSASPAPLPVVPPAPGAENAGKTGYYTVKPGDSLIRIGLEAGQSHKDIARWNALENPNRIEVGQVLRVQPPVAETAAVTKPVSSSMVAGAPLVNGAASAPVKAASAPVVAASAAVPAASSVANGSGDDDLSWIWPANGPTLTGFDDTKNKGVDIGGAAGDAVLAASDGRVVYAGASLRGYGNMIILKHNNTYLTAYAHNQALLVKEEQTVKKGQKIAEMGSSDADRVKLHFELRRYGKPVDPQKYLPPK
ncbi:MAG: peptidoglycan DD-metalloendopeptidase family protein [Rhodoferax sp.]|nr:peptidoglycan DD-metalloendopeptidase family protein [Rhodoferax sp.]